MNSKLIMLLFLFSAGTVSAQLTITPGAQFTVNGNMQLTLQNTDLVNNGSFASGNSITSFTGNLSSLIIGSQPVQFNQLEISKTGNALVMLQKDISVTQRILFSSGLFILNGKSINLGTTGFLDNERESSRIADVTGGQVLFNVNLNAPVAANPANIGLFITSGQNLGNVNIKRIHFLDTDSSGAEVNILRYYEVLPTVNTNLDATLRFTYFDSELNGFNENTLSLFQNRNNIDWVDLGFTSRDGVANFVEKTGISSLGKFTLSSASGVLPLHFTSFDVKCDGNNIRLNWKTAQEQNSRDFDIERNVDGRNWVTIGNIPAAGNSSTERNYSFFTANTSLQNAVYRIAAHDHDGRVQYTNILNTPCAIKDQFSVWPNPVHDVVFISIAAAGTSQGSIKIFDSKGALVKIQNANIARGNNQISVNMKPFANGVYALTVDWDNGQVKKTVKIVKQ
jgi:hypothetical protein